MAQKTLNVTCNNVNKRINRTEARFNIVNDDNDSSGNVNFNIQNEGTDFLGDSEPGKDYQIIIKEV